jgi:hypothetical protein
VAQARKVDQTANRVAALEDSLARAQDEAQQAVSQAEELAESLAAAQDALKVCIAFAIAPAPFTC